MLDPIPDARDPRMTKRTAAGGPHLWHLPSRSAFAKPSDKLAYLPNVRYRILVKCSCLRTILGWPPRSVPASSDCGGTDIGGIRFRMTWMPPSGTVEQRVDLRPAGHRSPWPRARATESPPPRAAEPRRLDRIAPFREHRGEAAVEGIPRAPSFPQAALRPWPGSPPGGRRRGKGHPPGRASRSPPGRFRPREARRRQRVLVRSRTAMPVAPDPADEM